MTTWIISSETVDELLVVVYPVAPAGHPAESAFDHPATGSALKCGWNRCGRRRYRRYRSR